MTYENEVEVKHEVELLLYNIVTQIHYDDEIDVIKKMQENLKFYEGLINKLDKMKKDIEDIRK